MSTGRRRAWRRVAAWALSWGWAAGIVSGCAVPSGPITGQGRPPAQAAFAPVAMRVHPLTHAVSSDGVEQELVCHVELTDAWGDSVKGSGVLRVMLFARRGPDGPAVQLATWTVDLTDMDRNAELWDRATRTYRVRLSGAPESRPAPATLRAEFDMAGGGSHADEMVFGR